MGNRLLRHALGAAKLDEISDEDRQRVVDEMKYASFKDFVDQHWYK